MYGLHYVKCSLHFVLMSGEQPVAKRKGGSTSVVRTALAWIDLPRTPRDGKARLHRADQVASNVRLGRVPADPYPALG